MSLIDAIKARYPDPASSEDMLNMPDCYCVGGAVTMFATLPADLPYAADIAFPDVVTIAKALCLLCPGLPYKQACCYAEDMTYANDTGKLAMAWSIAEEALTYRETLEEPA